MVMKLPKMQDMARSIEDETSMGLPFAMGEKIHNYPCGLQITLCHPELEKLGLDDNVEVGDLIHLFSMGEVTGINKTDVGDGEQCRITIQLKFMSCENEEIENEEEDKEEPEEKPKRGKLKGKSSLYF